MCGSVFTFLLVGEHGVSLELGRDVGFGSQSCHSPSPIENGLWWASGSFRSKLMITEKIDAAVEASYSLLKNGDVTAVVARYREHVSANADRLSLR
jgi:hypothetical protein